MLAFGIKSEISYTALAQHHNLLITLTLYSLWTLMKIVFFKDGSILRENVNEDI